ncbi:M48 family metalloprotease [Phormidesmis sp. 146-35]
MVRTPIAAQESAMRLRAWKRLQKATSKILLVSFAIVLLLHPMLVAMRAVATTPTVEKPAEKPAETKPTPEASPQPADKKRDDPIVPIKTSEETARLNKLAEGDRLYQAGDKAAAEKLYREAKPPFAGTSDTKANVDPITDPTQLSPGGQVYWRESGIGLEQKLESRIFVPLKLLTDNYPQFVPGYLRYAEALEAYDRPEESLAILEKAATLYPNQPDLAKARITALEKNEKWIEASIAARQFALLNPTDPNAPTFTTLADTNLKRYQGRLRSRLRGNLVGNILTGALGYALTGNLFGPLSAVQNTVLLLRGESAVGERVTRQAKRQLDLVDDKAVLSYVDQLGQKLADAAGRKEFKYEFYVVMDDRLNAFALPGGKVFVNAGAIAKTNSEAELAGLLGHELSHTVLSHGFQLVSEGTLTANLTQFIPYVGGLLSNLSTLSYSRDMERQADILGTRLLVSTGFAADGLHNLMVTLKQQEAKKNRPSPPAWFATHPLTKDRIKYIEALIKNTGYNRYAYEGVERHAMLQTKVETLLKEYKAQQEKKGRRERSQDE